MMKLLLYPFSIFLLALLPVVSRAVDGVLEINQACAVNAGCFAGDSAGFPVSISAPGSYWLTSNLSATVDAHGISVAANDVTIDLNGFTLSGQATCTGAGSTLSCSGSSSGIGINATSMDAITVQNGRIRGFGSAGLSLGSRGNVLDLVVEGNANFGISAFSELRVSGSQVNNNEQSGVTVSGIATVVKSSFKANRMSGISAGSGSLVTDTLAFDNGQHGISVGGGSVVRNSRAYANEDDGIRVGVGSVVSDCSAYFNENDGFVGGDGVTMSNNSAYQNFGNVQSFTDNGIDCGNGCTIQGNTIRDNAGIGINLGGVESAYRGNVVTENGFGTVSGGTNRGDNYCAGTGVISAFCP